MENVKTKKLGDLMKDDVKFDSKAFTTYQLKGHIIVSLNSESEFYDEKTGELLKDWTDHPYSRKNNYKYNDILQRNFTSFIDPIVYVKYDNANDSTAMMYMMSNEDVPELLFKASKDRGSKCVVLSTSIAGMMSRSEIENILAKVEENGVLFADVVSLIKGRLVSDEEHSEFMQKRVVYDQISANSYGSLRLYNIEDVDIPVLTSDKQNAFIFEIMPKVDLRNVITDREELIRYIKSNIPNIYHKFVEKAFRTIITKDVLKWQNTANLHSKFADICKSWVENTKVPKCEYDVQYTSCIPRLYTEFDDQVVKRNYKVFKDYWCKVNTYVDVKEFAESIITANETKLINKCLPYTSLAMLNVITGQHITPGFGPNFNVTNPFSHKPGSWYLDDIIRNSYFWTIPTKLDYNYPVNLYTVVTNFAICNNFIYKMTDEEEEVYGVHTQNIDPETLIPIVYAFTVMDTTTMKSYIPKIENLIKILSAKLDRHIARSMDFSSCTIDNVTNYVEDRKIRIDYLNTLISSFNVVLDIINSIQGDKISILDLYEKMMHEFKVGSCHFNNHAGTTFIWNDMVQMFDSCFGVLEAIDEFYPEITDIDKKFNTILKTIAVTKPMINKINVQDGKNIVQSLSIFDLTFRAIAISEYTNK